MLCPNLIVFPATAVVRPKKKSEVFLGRASRAAMWADVSTMSYCGISVADMVNTCVGEDEGVYLAEAGIVDPPSCAVQADVVNRCCCGAGYGGAEEQCEGCKHLRVEGRGKNERGRGTLGLLPRSQLRPCALQVGSGV